MHSHWDESREEVSAAHLGVGEGELDTPDQGRPFDGGEGGGSWDLG